MLNKSGTDIHVPAEDGRWISERHARISELIQEYDRELRLQFIPPEYRISKDDPPYRIIHRMSDGYEYTVLYADELDERILARLYLADGKHHNVQDFIEAKNKAARKLQAKERQEQMEQAHDLAATILRSPLHRFKHDGKVYE